MSPRLSPRLAGFVLLLGATILLRAVAAGSTPVVPPAMRYQLPAAYLRMFTLSYDSIVSDVLWIHFVQAVPNRPADPPLAAALASELRAIVELDPQFRAAYLHGSILLTVLGSRPCDSLEILERGMERSPGDWRLAFQAGYNCFAEIGDPVCAAHHMQRAASIPGSPAWLPALVARLLSDSTQHDGAVEYLQRELSRTTDPRLKERFEERLNEAMLGRDLARIDAAARAFRQKNGRDAETLEQLVAAGSFPGGLSPWDPFGGTYSLREGRAYTTSGRQRLTAFRREHQLVGRFEERLLEESVIARLSKDIGKPWWLRSARDGLAASAGLVESTLQGIETAIGWSEPGDIANLRQTQARAMLRHDLNRLEGAWLAILREDSSRKPTIEEIAARAGVDVVDPFGTRYRFGDAGEPSTAADRVALSPIMGAYGKGSARCR